MIFCAVAKPNSVCKQHHTDQVKTYFLLCLKQFNSMISAVHKMVKHGLKTLQHLLQDF